MKRRRWILPIAILLLVFVVGSYTAAWLVMPFRADYGATWETYLEEPRNSVDVLYFGSSLVYCNVVPSVIWEKTGVTTYAMAGPEQTIPITYYYIKEACRTQNPKVVAVEVTGMFYKEFTSFTKANITYMPWSMNRLAATFNAAESELRAGLLFPPLEYHGLWMSASADRIKRHLNPGIDAYAGYTYLDQSVAQGEPGVRDFSAETENYARNLEYLRKIQQYCQRRGIELLLFVTPAKNRIPEVAMNQLRQDIAAMEGVHFTDFNEVLPELDIDDGADWFDPLHFNCRGAEKFSARLGEYLCEEFGLAPTEGEDESLWQHRVGVFAEKRNSVQ